MVALKDTRRSSNRSSSITFPWILLLIKYFAHFNTIYVRFATVGISHKREYPHLFILILVLLKDTRRSSNRSFSITFPWILLLIKYFAHFNTIDSEILQFSPKQWFPIVHQTRSKTPTDINLTSTSIELLCLNSLMFLSLFDYLMREYYKQIMKISLNMPKVK